MVASTAGARIPRPADECDSRSAARVNALCTPEAPYQTANSAKPVTATDRRIGSAAGGDEEELDDDDEEDEDKDEGGGSFLSPEKPLDKSVNDCGPWRPIPGSLDALTIRS